ncbi:MAG: glycosyltransferase family 4 protein [Bacteroidales bacterium]
MNILILTNKLPYPPRDGGSIATFNLMTGLRDAGHRITVLSINTRKHPFPVDQIPDSLRDSIRFLAVEADTRIRPLAMLGNLMFSREPYIAGRFHLAGYTHALEQLLAEETYDLIQLEGPYLGHYIPVIRHRSSTPVSLRAHNVEHQIWRKKAEHEAHPLRRRYLRNMARRLQHFEQKVAEASDLLVPISEVDEAAFRDLGIRIPMLTTPAGLPVTRYPPSTLPTEPTLFFIGALDWLPNQEGLEWFLGKVFPALTGRVPALRFHVAGRNAPDHMARKMKHPLITFHGEVEDAVTFMQTYRVMVAPLKTGSGMRIKILEGMAVGRPVVTTAAGIEGIGATHGKEVMVSDSPEEWADLLEKLLTGDREATGLALKGREFVSQNFDTFEVANRLSQFYKTQV